jgi:hypothetical protein
MNDKPKLYNKSMPKKINKIMKNINLSEEEKEEQLATYFSKLLYIEQAIAYRMGLQDGEKKGKLKDWSFGDHKFINLTN